jgi:hypothetical protein
VKKPFFVANLLVFALMLSSCNRSVFEPTPISPAHVEPYKIIPPENTPTSLPLPTPTQIPLGPKTYPFNINPLSGLPVKDATSLTLPPVLASISNFPPTARPQAGLSYSPMVFEIFIGDGMTRNLAVFYGDYPGQAFAGNATQTIPGSEAVIGPIRSGRISYEKFRMLYNGLLVMASAYKSVAEELNQYTNIFGSDSSDVNSALLKVSRLKEIAESSEKRLEGAALSGMYFNSNPPDGGKAAQSLWLFYSNLNQIFWRFNVQDGMFHRFQDNADGANFIEATDRLNGQSLKYANVIVLFVRHDVIKKYNIDLDLLFKKKESALLFRDGKVYEIYWTTLSGEYEQSTGKLRPIRFIDQDGNPVPLKPGQTWIHTIPLGLQVWETVNSEKYNQLMAGTVKGSGYWALRFKDPTPK